MFTPSLLSLCLRVMLTVFLPAISSAALVSQYTFDNITHAPPGEDYVNDDAAEGGNHQLQVSGRAELVAGVRGSALFFDKPPVYYAATNAAGNAGFMTGVSGITLLGWVKPASLPAPSVDVGIISMLSVGSNPLNSRFVMALNSAGQVEVGARAADASPYQSRFTLAALSLNEWTCVAAVIDYENDFIDIYINGEKQALTAGTALFSASATSNTSGAFFGLGAGNFGRGEIFHGALDEMSFYDEALTSDQIRNLSRIPEPSSAGLIALGAGALGLSRGRAKVTL